MANKAYDESVNYLKTLAKNVDRKDFIKKYKKIIKHNFKRSGWNNFQLFAEKEYQDNYFKYEDPADSKYEQTIDEYIYNYRKIKNSLSSEISKGLLWFHVIKGEIEKIENELEKLITYDISHFEFDLKIVHELEIDEYYVSVMTRKYGIEYSKRLCEKAVKSIELLEELMEEGGE